jgi:hypothetical protein
MKKNYIILETTILAAFFCILLGFLSCAEQSLGPETGIDRERVEALANGELAWIASLQLPNGAISLALPAMNQVSVNPYFAAFACMALLERNTYAPAVKDFFKWYCTHQNADGTIYDYSVTFDGTDGFTEASTGDYDSSDSYAAVFLSTVYKYWMKTGDGEFLYSIRDTIERSIGAINLTLDKDLTWAKPDYRIKYLMDNCEVYAGLSDAAKMYREVFHDPVQGDRLAQQAEAMARAIEAQLWDAEAGHYHCYTADGIVNRTFSWDEFYPDAVSQLFPIIYGLIEPDSIRAQSLYAAFNRVYSSEGSDYHWETLNTPDVFPWALICYAAAIMGDARRVDAYYKAYSAAYAENHPYPVYNAEAAFVVLAGNRNP